MENNQDFDPSDPNNCLSAADMEKLLGKPSAESRGGNGNDDDDPTGLIGAIRRQAADQAAASKPKTPSIKEYAAARDTVLAYPHPLATIPGEVFALQPEQGWVHVTGKIRAILDERMGRSANGAMSILLNRLQIPDVSHLDVQTVYYQRSGSDHWSIYWHPYHVAPEEVVFADGIYNAVTHQVRPAPAVLYGPRVTLPFHFDETDQEAIDAEQQAFAQAVAYALPDPDVARHFQEVLATVLQPHYHVRHQVVLWGAPHSGKSTLATAIVTAPAGRSGAAWAQESQITRDKWATILLHNRFACVSDDSAKTKNWVPFLKSYTSGHLLIEGKGHRPLCVAPSAKLISTCNEMQDLQDPSGAAAQRIVSFHFTKPRPRTHAINQDQWLRPEYWATPIRRQAVIGWLLQGLDRLHSRGGFLIPASWRDQNEEAIRDSDPTLALLQDKLAVAPDSRFLPTTTIRQLVDLSPQALSGYIARLFPSARKAKARVDGERHHGYYGIRLADDGSDPV